MPDTIGIAWVLGYGWYTFNTLFSVDELGFKSQVFWGGQPEFQDFESFPGVWCCHFLILVRDAESVVSQSFSTGQL